MKPYTLQTSHLDWLEVFIVSRKEVLKDEFILDAKYLQK